MSRCTLAWPQIELVCLFLDADDDREYSKRNEFARKLMAFGLVVYVTNDVFVKTEYMKDSCVWRTEIRKDAKSLKKPYVCSTVDSAAINHAWAIADAINLS